MAIIAQWSRGGTSHKMVQLVRNDEKKEPNRYQVHIDDMGMEDWVENLCLIGATNFFNAAVQMMKEADDD